VVLIGPPQCLRREFRPIPSLSGTSHWAFSTCRGCRTSDNRNRSTCVVWCFHCDMRLNLDPAARTASAGNVCPEGERAGNFIARGGRRFSGHTSYPVIERNCIYNGRSLAQTPDQRHRFGRGRNGRHIAGDCWRPTAEPRGIMAPILATEIPPAHDHHSLLVRIESRRISRNLGRKNVQEMTGFHLRV
jgi:hypothetical protein